MFWCNETRLKVIWQKATAFDGMSYAKNLSTSWIIIARWQHALGSWSLGCIGTLILGEGEVVWGQWRTDGTIRKSDGGFL